jgi:hypothetical protein
MSMRHYTIATGKRKVSMIATLVSGAYQMSMASACNGFPRPAAVMVADGEAWLMQRRETLADLLCRDVEGAYSGRYSV